MTSHEQVQDALLRMLETEKALSCGEDSQRSYLSLHRNRFEEIMRLCRRYVPDRSARVLDIGRSELTGYLATFYGDVHTLGFDPEADDGGHREQNVMDAVPHITFDLLRADRVTEWPDCGPFDLIVFSEVIEHLSIAPEYTLTFLGSLLTEKGVLICTTPNAAEIGKRLRMLAGKNPYERLRLYALNPGHIREYTREELCAIADRAGLRFLSHGYFDWSTYQNRGMIRRFGAKMLRAYPAFRPFQSLVVTRMNSSPSGR